MTLLEVLPSYRKELNHFFASYLDYGQGLRVGESSVVSKRVHQVTQARLGEVAILTNLDAGQWYLGAGTAAEHYTHIDIFHAPGLKANLPTLADRLKLRVSQFFPEEKLQEVVINTNPKANHIHILLPLVFKEYSFIPVLVDETEVFLQEAGVQIRKVKKFIHQEYLEKGEESSIGPAHHGSIQHFQGLDPFGTLAMQRSVLSLASTLGSVQSAAELLHSIGPSGKLSLADLSTKHGGLTSVINELIDEGYVKRTLWGGYRLTSEGDLLAAFTDSHSKELEAELRKVVRKVPVVSTKIEGVSFRNKQRFKFIDSQRGRIRPLEEGDWAASIAVPESLIQSRKRSLLEGDASLAIKREDLQIYRKLKRSPVDILLLIDASTSMRGKRLRSARYLAEHLVLTTKERVGVVVFQDKEAAVASGFTRNYDLLRRGLQSVKAQGLTPLASGLVESLKIIKRERAKNPLVILITDGLPTVPLYTSDPVADAIEAAKMLPSAKAKLVVVGLKPDESFLRNLAKAGAGTMYMVDDLERDALIRIANKEKAI